MKVLVTGGAGFIGRWVAELLFRSGHQVWVLDNLSNGRYENIVEFTGYEEFHFQQGDITDEGLLESLFKNNFDVCYHLAASINVQDSIDDPGATFCNDTVGTFNVLEQCKRHRVKMVYVSTCMVYDMASSSQGIDEEHPTKPVSPYAGAKLAAENMVLSYYHAFSLPVAVIRPFNTYGPFQKSSGEGGVIAIFIYNKLAGADLVIYGNGTQTRDFLYVEDCARCIVEAGFSDRVNGEIINAGLGQDISINQLAAEVVQDNTRIKHVDHIHPQSEIQKLLCNFDKVKRLLGWTPQVGLKEGLGKTQQWMEAQAENGH